MLTDLTLSAVAEWGKSWNSLCWLTSNYVTQSGKSTKKNSVCMYATELDRENPDFPPYLISHGQKVGLTCVLLASSEVADCLCAALQVWSGRNISALEVAQNYSVSLRTLFGKDRTLPNYYSIADCAIIHGGIGSPGSPCLILWCTQNLIFPPHFLLGLRKSLYIMPRVNVILWSRMINISQYKYHEYHYN